MKHHLPTIIFAFVGVVFLVSALMGDGELFKFPSTGVAGLLFLLAAVVSFVVRSTRGRR